MIKCIKLRDVDSVATMLDEGHVGCEVEIIDSNHITTGSFRLAGEVPFAFKVSLRNHEKNDIVYKAGDSIGKASEFIPAYTCVHVHNLTTIAGAYTRKGELT